ncbi:hypothetical protein Pd630_LPD11048 (plasmid) [Rhodococcus opacus PD630]|nr:hypothetical protein Pd630_LPD11048 [Rhodococcus opacus PD630]
MLAHRADLEQRVDEMWKVVLPRVMLAAPHQRRIGTVRAARSSVAVSSAV